MLNADLWSSKLEDDVDTMIKALTPEMENEIKEDDEVNKGSPRDL